MDHFVDLLLHRLVESCAFRREPRVRCGFAPDAADPAVEDQAEGASLRPGAGRKIADQFPVGGQSLAAGSLQPPFRREVGVSYDEVAVHGIVADGLEQEAFAAAVSPREKTKGGAAFGDDVDVVEQGFQLLSASDSDIGQSDSGNHAAFQ